MAEFVAAVQRGTNLFVASRNGAIFQYKLKKNVKANYPGA